ncbi:L-seryl-tRNA(Sec) selenium transferase [Sediminibacillus albus]|uniref:L-seryl-tRNA(Sec) selenium transferase n=1 Tax=Sediminibacillus albus TaxID=407036 RepID=A0A1G8WFN8_9BACI|nr:L-seryl-tRNA(Sec) selenium transferase [Sediminibacillus albus]SDJ77021.1 L-seryl-tRNA(Ser) seleniumtransferase [Sediminibacillus albus]
MKHLLRELPPVHEFQKSSRFQKVADLTRVPEQEVTNTIKEELGALRSRLLNGDNPVKNQPDLSFMDYVWQQSESKLVQFRKERLRQVINGTGTVLHTNLGRARLSKQAIEHVVQSAGSYSNLEYNLSEGKRGSRHEIIEDLLTKVTGAEAAMVVNNNAAAVYLVLRALAKEREVIVSRGQLVEIGGSFRVSSIMEESGARLVEVGTTNKTHVYDYQQAITEDTAMVLKVHTSNFKTIGFTQSVETEELADLKKQHKNLVFYEDLGSGSLYDFKRQGIGEEPLVREVIDDGADIVSFSGDKLLGGPQAGIIVGKKYLIDRLKKHQLARVLRIDKMTLAGLEKTLQTYAMGEEAAAELPAVRDIIKAPEAIKMQAAAFMKELQRSPEPFSCRLVETTSQIGGGTMPDVELATYAAAVSHKQLTAQQIAEKLRLGTPAIVARIKDEQVLIDFRTVSEEETPAVLDRFFHLGTS